MKIAIVQPDIIWENKQANLDHLESLTGRFKDSAEIFMLPEMFSTGFSMKSPGLAENENGITSQWLFKMAREYNAVFTGSIIFKSQDKYFNRLLWVQPDQVVHSYDKRHLFSMGDENKQFSKGQKQLCIDYRNWRIMPLICYDLRFPVWSRNSFQYDLLTYHANWPGVRNDVWVSLLKARAIENQAYVIGINRVGSDGEGIDYIGNSIAFSPKGHEILNLGKTEKVGIIDLDLKELHDFRNKFPAYLDGDKFKITD